MKPISALSNLYRGEVLRVIGSGPSLAVLTPIEIGAGPVIAINYALRKVETLNLPNKVYSMQKDQAYIDPCSAPILAHAAESAKHGDFGDYIFDNPTDFGIDWNLPSIVVCLHIAKTNGLLKVEYLCCDSFFDDFRSFDGKTTAMDRRAIQYAYHPGMVAREAERIGMQWFASRVEAVTA